MIRFVGMWTYFCYFAYSKNSFAPGQVETTSFDTTDLDQVITGGRISWFWDSSELPRMNVEQTHWNTVYMKILLNLRFMAFLGGNG